MGLGPVAAESRDLAVTYAIKNNKDSREKRLLDGDCSSVLSICLTLTRPWLQSPARGKEDKEK